MRNTDKQAMLTLIMEELPKHWLKRKSAIDKLYVPNDGYDTALVKQAVNYVIGEHYRRQSFDFDDHSAHRFDWRAQGFLAIISMHLVDQHETYGLNAEMVERARTLMMHVMSSNVPRSLLREGTSL